MFWFFGYIASHVAHFLLVAILTGYAGWFLAGKIGINKGVGLAVGLLGNVPGVLVLAVIWAVQYFSEQTSKS